MRILLAEDDSTLRVLLTGMLQKWEYEVVPATNGEEALAILAAPNPPRMAVLDWSMPIIDGVEVCRILKDRIRDRVGQYTYVIMLTQHDSPASVAAALNAGANDFIKKPAEPLELRSRLDAGKRLLDYENNVFGKEAEVRYECFRGVAALAENIDRAGVRHMARVARYAELISRGSGHPAELTAVIARHASLHDIGKIGLPESVLTQPNKLSRMDFELMKTHADLGRRLLEHVPGMTMAAEICHTHHEKWNGSGYPRGLAEVDIPLSGRVVALAEYYDVLRSRRPYKFPWTHEEAMRTLGEESGEHFDPMLVDIFFENEREALEIAAEHEGAGGDYT